jgi:succinoglycan biosynthesis protein ExoM
MPEIVVAIPTFRRPGELARLLDALEKLETNDAVAVIVADNDAQGREGYLLCRKRAAEGYRWPLIPAIAAERGIAQARNVLVGHALERRGTAFIAMIDDDEWPAPQWLKAFMAAQVKTGAGALGGTIVFENADAPRWAASFDGLATIRKPDGAVAMLEGAGNIFLSRRAFEMLTPPWFDPDFGLTGGEDRDFFERLKRAGCHFAWADGAVAYAAPPAARATLEWVLKRAFRIGNTEMRIFLKYRPSFAARLDAYARLAAALLLLPIASVILAPVPNRAADALRRLCRNAGKLAALFGRRHNEYAADGD